MTIRFIKSWNGYYEGQIVTSPNGNTEANLVAQNFASYDLDGPDNSPLPVTASKNLTGGLEFTAGGEVIEVGGEALGSIGTANRQFIGATSLSTLSGTPVFTTVSNVPVAQLPDAATTGLSLIFDGETNARYEVYLLWSNASAASGNVVFGMAYQPQTRGAALNGGVSLYCGVSALGNGVVERTQLPLSCTRTSDLTQMVFRLDRRGADAGDTLAGSINVLGLEFVPIPKAVDAVVVNAPPPTPVVYKTPYDGITVLHALAIYTPIWTSQNAVYLAEPVTISGVQQTRLAKLSKGSYSVIQDVQIAARTHDSVVGHRDGSVAVTDSGQVIAYGQAHHTPWEGKLATGEDLSAFAAITSPTGLSVNCSYRRFFRNPYDGSIWMCARGDTYTGGVYKWDNASLFTRRPTSQMLAGDSLLLGTYGLEIAFASATTVYATTEYMRVASGAASGFPRQNVGCVKTVDGGASWTTMGGKPVVLPLVPGNDDDIAFPSPNNLHDTVCSRIGVGADGQPIVIASWQHPDEPLRSMWAAKFNSTEKKWVRTRLLKNNGTWDTGNPHVIYTQAGKIFVCVASTDDHHPGSSSGGGAGERIPENNQLYIFTSSDSGATWTRYAVNHPAGGYGGAYMDSEAVRIDNVLRMSPRRESDPTASEIWEMPVPA